jgi:hypothetical protein
VDHSKSSSLQTEAGCCFFPNPEETEVAIDFAVLKYGRPTITSS